MVGSLPFGATYIAGGWIPVRLEVRNYTQREIAGTMRLLPMASEMPEFRVAVVSPPLSRVSKTIWAYFPASKDSLIARVTLNDSSGAMLARTELTGAPANVEAQFMPNGIQDHGYLISISGDEDFGSDQMLMDFLGEALSNSYEIRTNLVQLEVASAPSVWVPYKNAYAVELRSIDPDDFSPAQRGALLDYVRSGGVLLLAGPQLSKVGGSWLEPLLPVKLVGNRELNQAPSPTGGEPMKFGAYLPCAEAVEGDGKVLLRDGQFVHAAYRKYGHGRVVYTSFPAGALSIKDQDPAQLWYELLGMTRPPVGTAGALLQNQYPQLMEPMLGRQAASWGIAAFAVGGLVLLVVIGHTVWRGANRPTAFKVTLAACVLVSAAFAVFAMLRQDATPLQEARLTIVDASAEGSLVNEYAAISGSQQSIDRTVQDSAALVWPTLLRQDRPVLGEWPASLQRIDVYPQRVDLVSHATQLREDARATARGRFGANGLELTLQNDLGVALSSTQLGWGSHRMSLPGIGATGASEAVANRDNLRPADEYTAASGLTSQDEQHKGAILRAALTTDQTSRLRKPWPAIYGWTGAWPAVTTLGEVKPDRVGSQTLVRIPLTLEPSVGSVRIDGMFNSLYVGEARGIPYDAGRQEFIRSQMAGAWLVAVDYPKEVGLLQPTKARLTLDLSTAQHTVQIRTGQCQSGRKPARPAAQGPLVADWNGAVGLNSAEFECTPADFDEQGRLWLLVSVQQSGAAGSLGLDPQWQFGRFNVDLEGQITAKK